MMKVTLKDRLLLFVITSASAFVLFMTFGLIIHLCYPPYRMDVVLVGAVGCGVGSGIGNAIFF